MILLFIAIYLLAVGGIVGLNFAAHKGNNNNFPNLNN